MNKIDLDEIGIKKIKIEVERFKKFQRVILGNKDKIEIGDIDIRNYAKYILREGSILKKRELLACLKGRKILRDGKLEIN